MTERAQKGEPVSKKKLVNRIITYALALGRRIATTTESRQMPGLTPGQTR